MRKNKQLDILIKMSEKRLQQQLLILSQAKNDCISARQKYFELLDYQKEYNFKVNQLLAQGVAGQQYQEFQKFLRQVEQAIAQQKILIDKLDSKREYATKKYKVAKTERDKFTKLVEKRDNYEQVVSKRQAQKENDEHAQNQWYISKNDDS